MPDAPKQAKEKHGLILPVSGTGVLVRFSVIGKLLAQRRTCLPLAMALFLSMPQLPTAPAQAAPAEKGAADATTGNAPDFREAVALYQSGRFEKALKLARTLAAEGHLEAQAMLGVLHEQGKGVERNPSKAAQWFERAATGGHTGAMFALAMLHLDGRLGKKDVHTARYWLEQAARRGMAEAQYNLALLHTGAGNAPANWQQAAKWFRKAAEQGNAHAQYNLGVLYLTGKGVPQDFHEASEWFKKAALAGLPQGATEYGLLVFRGNGVQKNENIGASWLLYAARSGYAPAMQKLARLHALGRGVRKDAIEAAKWYLLARQRGARDTWLDLFLKHLSDEQMKQARRLAAAFRPTRMRPANRTTPHGKGQMLAPPKPPRKQRRTNDAAKGGQ